MTYSDMLFVLGVAVVWIGLVVALGVVVTHMWLSLTK